LEVLALKLIIKSSSFKYGTQRDRNLLDQWQEYSIVELIVSF